MIKLIVDSGSAPAPVHDEKKSLKHVLPGPSTVAGDEYDSLVFPFEDEDFEQLMAQNTPKTPKTTCIPKPTLEMVYYAPEEYLRLPCCIIICEGEERNLVEQVSHLRTVATKPDLTPRYDLI